jgi:transposase
MATPQKEQLRALTAEEQAVLERLVKRTSERVDRVRRARALLAVAQGEAFASAARQVGLQSGTAVANLVSRFNRHGLAALQIRAGRGRKPTYDGEARVQIVATAQRAPERREDGTATWSLSTLQRTLRRDQYPRIGTSTIRRVLEAAGSSYQRTRSWCPTGTARGSGRAASSRWSTRRRRKKGPDRASVWFGGGGWTGALVPGRSGSLPDSALSGSRMATGR